MMPTHELFAVQRGYVRNNVQRSWIEHHTIQKGDPVGKALGDLTEDYQLKEEAVAELKRHCAREKMVVQAANGIIQSRGGYVWQPRLLNSYVIECPRCEYRWMREVEHPRKCPLCQTRMNWGKE